MILIEDILKGSLSTKDKLAPSYINNKNPKFLEIDGKYFSGIMIVDYTRENNDIL